ncbi:hypothetical protein FD723_13855 [Nostoc sp. C052]|uniref:hypothetical protein n=1 Tax=unclassified Nostoc TaxID=2593658 RepID=UPI0015C39AF1|nr:hypothetical protein [Nostoc sp. C052]QLE41418.1 hypothetical protein FD723_13855 [Nostoc sp. C052]
MKQTWKGVFISSLMAVSLASVSLVPAQKASADEHILRDIGIGAGAGVLSGTVVRRRGSLLNNAIKGAAAGAAVNGVNGTRSRYHRKHRNLGQDVGVGAAASTVTGAVTRGGKDTLGDAVDGAVAGAAIHLLTNGKN